MGSVDELRNAKDPIVALRNNQDSSPAVGWCWLVHLDAFTQNFIKFPTTVSDESRMEKKLQYRN